MQKRTIQGLIRFLTIFGLLAMPLQVVLADGGGEGVEKEVNGYHIGLVFSESPKLGENEFHIQITDSMGMPVTNAELTLMAVPYQDISKHEEDSTAESHGADSMEGMDVHAVVPTESEIDSMHGMDMSEETQTDEMNTGSHDEPQDDHGASQDDHDKTSTQEIVLEAGHAAGEYAGTISLHRPGAWIFHLQFTVDGQLTEVEFPVSVAGIDAKYGILAGFVGINATVISVAAITKRKPIVKKA